MSDTSIQYAFLPLRIARLIQAIAIHKERLRNDATRELLEQEMGHVLFALEFCTRYQDLNQTSVQRSQTLKSLTIGDYLHFQEKQ